MRELWAKSNIWMLTAAGAAVAMYMALNLGAMPAGQRALGFFVVAITLHEWEEGHFPGGFYELMTKKFGVEDYTREQADLSHGAVVVAIAFFAFVPFLLWERIPWLAGIPAILGFFEAVIHVMGIKIHNLPHPYSPGMATALLCLLPSSVAIAMFATPGIGAGGWALATVCYLAIFAWRSWYGAPSGSTRTPLPVSYAGLSRGHAARGPGTPARLDRGGQAYTYVHVIVGLRGP